MTGNDFSISRVLGNIKWSITGHVKLPLRWPPSKPKKCEPDVENYADDSGNIVEHVSDSEKHHTGWTDESGQYE